MKVVVFGGTGRVGRLAVRKALQAGHEVTVMVRHPVQLEADRKLEIITGDVLNQHDVNQAMAGKDAVLLALGISPTTTTPVLSEGTNNIILSMKQSNIKRLVAITAWGAGDSKKDANLLTKLAMTTVLRSIFRQKKRQEQMIKDSGLDWTIVRPATLVGGAGRLSYDVLENQRMKQTAHIARIDVADFMVKQLTTDRWLHKAVELQY